MSVNDIRNIKTYDDIKNFIKDNKQIMKFFKDSKSLGGLMGSGDYGIVWELSNNNRVVLKVTTDSVEMDIAEQLYAKKTKGFLRIYACETLDKIQIRIQDRCEPLKSTDYTAKLVNYGQNVYDNNMDYEDYKNQTIGVIKNTPSGGEDFINDITERQLEDSFDLLNRLYDDYKRINLPDEFEDYDFNAGNIMKTKDGRYVAIDF